MDKVLQLLKTIYLLIPDSIKKAAVLSFVKIVEEKIIESENKFDDLLLPIINRIKKEISEVDN